MTAGSHHYPTEGSPTEGRMFLINLFGKKVGADDSAGGGWKVTKFCKYVVKHHWIFK